jgi:hypothetical protein
MNALQLMSSVMIFSLQIGLPVHSVAVELEVSVCCVAFARFRPVNNRRQSEASNTFGVIESTSSVTSKQFVIRVTANDNGSELVIRPSQ